MWGVTRGHLGGASLTCGARGEQREARQGDGGVGPGQPARPQHRRPRREVALLPEPHLPRVHDLHLAAAAAAALGLAAAGALQHEQALARQLGVGGGHQHLANQR